MCPIDPLASANSGVNIATPEAEIAEKPAVEYLSDAKFRINRNNVGLTYSCPVGSANPLTFESLQTHFDSFGPNKYLIGRELHPSNGENHFHVLLKYASKLDIKNCHAFDVDGVHPNVLRNPPGNGWAVYCAKDDDYRTNYYEVCPYKAALEAPSVREGIAILKRKVPKDIVRFGEQIERNLRRHIAGSWEMTYYLGPYPAHYFPEDWNPRTHTLLLWGEPGTNKTQFAMYLIAHLFGPFEYIKAKYEEGRKLTGLPFIFDEAYMLDAQTRECSREICCVECGGTVQCRQSNYTIPPGVPRIFVSNIQHPLHNPGGAVYGRRVVQWEIKW